jgi:transposase InsO family protein
MDNQRPWHTVRLMARVLQVSSSGYYKWINRTESQTIKRKKILKVAIFEAFHEFKKRYGAPRITYELNEMGINCSKNYVALLLRQMGLKARNGRKFRYSVNSLAMQNVSENILKRKFTAETPNQKWSTDITYIYANGKWLYLAIVMDLYSRAIVGWALQRYMTYDLINEALEMAIARRDIQKGLIVHSDRGVQYRSNEYRQKLLDNGCKISMSRRGNCWDNAVVESFFSRFKVECIYGSNFKSINHAKVEIFEYIDIFYNRKRKHSALGYVSPMQFEQLNS